MYIQSIQLLLVVLFCSVAVMAARNSFKRMVRCRQARKYQQEHSRPAVYEVGSPEYNAQIVSAIRTLNGQIADQGKHLPEKTAIQVIHSTSSEDGR